jgi:hypothetical protein
MNYVSYFSPVIKPGKRRRFFAALTKGFELGGPSRETLTGHQSDSSSPPTKGKARPLLQPPVITTTAQKTGAVETMRKCPGANQPTIFV